MEKILAYAAGIIDGEGSIMLIRSHANEFRSPCVSITNTTFSIIEFLQSHFGGHVVRQKTYKTYHKTAWIWKLHGLSVLRFLESILPYMLEPEKIRRANLLVSRYNLVTKRNGKYDAVALTTKLQFQQDFLHPSIP